MPRVRATELKIKAPVVQVAGVAIVLIALVVEVVLHIVSTVFYVAIQVGIWVCSYVVLYIVVVLVVLLYAAATNSCVYLYLNGYGRQHYQIHLRESVYGHPKLSIG